MLASGCATQTFLLSGANSTLDYETSETFFVAGIGQEVEVNAAEVCGGADSVAKVETELRAIDVVFSYITGGIYSPRTSRVYCKS